MLLCVWSFAGSAAASTYGIARGSVPVLNSASFSTVFGGQEGKTLKSDHCGQVRELEFIALPGTAFKIHGETKDRTTTIYRVETEDYQTPAGVSLYVDSRFIEVRKEKPVPRERMLPSAAYITAVLKGSIGSPYVWGGNLQAGVTELAELFYKGEIAVSARGHLLLAGLDCSGLLYQATGGWTPRNTAQLVSYGTAVPVAGKTVEVIADLLKPLDLIVWNGHVLIVLDRDTIIESRLECGRKGNGGVVATALRQRLSEIMRTRRPVDSWPAAGKQRDVFVVRRWYSP